MKAKTIEAAKVAALLNYDPETGLLVWKKNGATAGTVTSRGYVVVTIDRSKWQGHRIAWAIANGSCDNNLTIDHLNGNPSDNRLRNLRLVPLKTNCENISTTRRNSSLGMSGVAPYQLRGRTKFRAYIYIGGKQKNLGCFDTAEEAHAIYVAKKRELHKGFAR